MDAKRRGFYVVYEFYSLGPVVLEDISTYEWYRFSSSIEMQKANLVLLLIH
jgi:hypothetical protein